MYRVHAHDWKSLCQRFTLCHLSSRYYTTNDRYHTKYFRRIKSNYFDVSKYAVISYRLCRCSNKITKFIVCKAGNILTVFCDHTAIVKVSSSKFTFVNATSYTLTQASRYSILRSRVVSFSLRTAILDLQDISERANVSECSLRGSGKGRRDSTGDYRRN